VSAGNLFRERAFVKCERLAHYRSLRSAIHEMRLHEAPFTTLTIRDLGDPQIEYFVRKWYEQARTRRGTPNYEANVLALLEIV
jgi:hypothetical protein